MARSQAAALVARAAEVVVEPRRARQAEHARGELLATAYVDEHEPVRRAARAPPSRQRRRSRRPRPRSAASSPRRGPRTRRARPGLCTTVAARPSRSALRTRRRWCLSMPARRSRPGSRRQATVWPRVSTCTPAGVAVVPEQRVEADEARRNAPLAAPGVVALPEARRAPAPSSSGKRAAVAVRARHVGRLVPQDRGEGDVLARRVEEERPPVVEERRGLDVGAAEVDVGVRGQRLPLLRVDLAQIAVPSPARARCWSCPRRAPARDAELADGHGEDPARRARATSCRRTRCPARSARASAISSRPFTCDQPVIPGRTSSRRRSCSV